MVLPIIRGINLEDSRLDVHWGFYLRWSRGVPAVLGVVWALSDKSWGNFLRGHLISTSCLCTQRQANMWRERILPRRMNSVAHCVFFGHTPMSFSAVVRFGPFSRRNLVLR